MTGVPVAAALALVVAACADGADRAPPRTAGVPTAAGTSAAGAAATRLRASATCAGEPPRPRVILRWRPSGAGRQRVQVTLRDDSWRDARRSRLLRRRTGRLTWPRPAGEARHFWRVLTRADGRWVASRRGSFEGPGCVGIDPQLP